MGTRLNKAPVFFTLAQMHFNPVLIMEPFLPALQEAFREAGFPDYLKTSEKKLGVVPDEEGIRVHEQIITRFIFRNKTKTAAFLLDPGALTYKLTDYPVFNEFSDIFLRALEIVHGHRAIEYCDRLGMRMLDAVQPLNNETLEQYLVPQALGFIGLIDEDIEHQQTLTESLFKSDTRTLIVRAVRVPQGVAAPPDLLPLHLELAKRFSAHSGETVMLDCDSFDEGRVDFSVQEAKAKLVELKSALSRSFKALVTPHALKAWE